MYWAEMSSAPTPSFEVVNVQVPLLLRAEPEPMGVEPSKNSTVPVAAEPLSLGVTVAVKVTDCP